MQALCGSWWWPALLVKLFFLSPALVREVLVYVTLSQWDRWHERCGSARQLPQLGRCHLNLKHPLAGFVFSACTCTFAAPHFLVKRLIKRKAKMTTFLSEAMNKMVFSYGITCEVPVISHWSHQTTHVRHWGAHRHKGWHTQDTRTGPLGCLCMCVRENVSKCVYTVISGIYTLTFIHKK